MRSNLAYCRDDRAFPRPASLTSQNVEVLVANDIIFTPEELATEEWIRIANHEKYEVSNLGRVRSVPHVKIKSNGVKISCKGKILYQTLSKGYCVVNIGKKRHRVHRLVMLAFSGYSEFPVNHKNKIRNDNRVSNLEYVTTRENTLHSQDRKYYTGVTKARNGRFRAFLRIIENGAEKSISLGQYATPEEASLAYKKYVTSKGFSTKYMKFADEEAQNDD